MKIIAGLVIDKRIVGQAEVTEYIKHVQSYINHIDELYIYNMTSVSIESFLNELKRYDNIEVASIDKTSEAELANIIMNKAIIQNADFAIFLKLGYYYEEGAFLALKRYLMENKHEKISLISPMPLFGCVLHERTSEVVREIKGCRIFGCLINTAIYQEIGPFDESYYQTMFDYDYELASILKSKRVILLPNEVLRNNNYRILERRIGFIKTSTYDRDVMDVYYETRNRRFLWDKYEKLFPEYVKRDKKLEKLEIREMRSRDKSFFDKKVMIDQAKLDYKLDKKGIYSGIK